MAIMRYSILILLILIQIACRQKDKPTETNQFGEPNYDSLAIEDNEYYAGQACVYEKSDRLTSNTFPFNKSDKIELVAYDRRDSYSNDELIRDGKFIVPDILQRQSLSKHQIDSLLSILHNFSRAVSENDEFEADCYDPHHSIVFYQKGQAIAFYEICFSCGGTRQTKDVDFGLFCSEKLCFLQHFFKYCKVDLGIVDEMCE
jgi:hypothetical protein